MESPLAGRTIAVPESRELEVFAAMLERRGARVLRCPLVAIRDCPDPTDVLAFARELAQGRYDDLILMTGEGLRRLLAAIDRHEPALRPTFLTGLGAMRRITRGPKPARVLRELGLKPDIAAAVPTTAGIIESLTPLDLAGRHVAVQLYGSDANPALTGFLESRGAHVRTVAPYVYADAADTHAVQELLQQLATGAVDAIAFTSTPQVERLFAVGGEATGAALRQTVVAAVGPVVAGTLERHGVTAQLMPAESFFLKPLTSALEAALRPQP
jgi:uroporphyrinogen-III synthase